MQKTNNTIYLRRRSKICLPATEGSDPLPESFLTSMVKNIEKLGYTFSEPLYQACKALSLEQWVTLYQELTTTLQKEKGAHQLHRPMYPNFPEQVERLSRVTLTFNAVLHYFTRGRFIPPTVRKERAPLLEKPKPRVIDLGTQAEFEGLFGQIASSNASISEQDREDLSWFVQEYGQDIARLLPENVPQKENVAFLASLLIEHTEQAEQFVSRYCRTATDVLRLAVGMSGGDVSLATATRFRSFKRAERSLFLKLLDQMSNPIEDMLRWKGRWIRLGERLHPREYSKKYPKAAKAFRILRNDLPVETFNSQVESALAINDTGSAIEHLRTRPGEFARRLDQLLRLNPNCPDSTAEAFGSVTEKVSTPVLLQVRQHFLGRRRTEPLRVFFPKGNLAKAYAISNTLPELSEPVCSRIIALCEQALIERFQKLPSLGKVYLDQQLARYIVPFSQRSASKSFRTIARGSKLPLPTGRNTLRLFLWWKNGISRTDIDLSAAMFDAEFCYKEVISYYNLKSDGCLHSGDIVDAPKGASEFIDLQLSKVKARGIRYVVMVLNSYSQQPYCELPECFAGWMAREMPKSGEIYEPKTVQDRLDLTSNSRIAIPLIIDLEAEQVIWCDMALRNEPRWNNNVHSNLGGITATLQSLIHLNKPNLYDLFALHTAARGERVYSPEEAETVFSEQAGIQFQQEEVASDYLC